MTIFQPASAQLTQLPQREDLLIPRKGREVKDLRQEDLIEGVGQTDEGPREPDHDGGYGHLSGAEETLQVEEHLLGRCPVALVRRLYLSAGSQSLDRQRTGAVVLGGKEVENLDNLLVLAQAEQVLWCLLETDNGDAQNR